MGMVWLSSIPKPRPTPIGLLQHILHHPIAFPHHPGILWLMWDCYESQSTIPFLYYPTTLLLIWDCYGSQTTIPFPYYPSILWLIWDCCKSRSTIPLLCHPDILASDVGMIWILFHVLYMAKTTIIKFLVLHCITLYWTWKHSLVDWELDISSLCILMNTHLITNSP